MFNKLLFILCLLPSLSNLFAKQAELNPPLADHFYVIIKSEDYQQFKNSPFLQKLGFLEFHKNVKIGNRSWNGIYLSGQSFYIEFFSDSKEKRNVQPNDLLAPSGLGFISDPVLFEKHAKAFPENSIDVLRDSGPWGNFVGYAIHKQLHLWSVELNPKSMGIDGPYTRESAIKNTRKQFDPNPSTKYALKDLLEIHIELNKKTEQEAHKVMKQMGFAFEKKETLSKYSSATQSFWFKESTEKSKGIIEARFSLDPSVSLDWNVGDKKNIGSLSLTRVSEDQLLLKF